MFAVFLLTLAALYYPVTGDDKPPKCEWYNATGVADSYCYRADFQFIENIVGDPSNVSELAIWSCPRSISVLTAADLRRFPNLTNLRLFDTYVTSIDADAISSAVHLEQLTLSNNYELSVIDQTILKNSNLEGLVIHGTQHGLTIHENKPLIHSEKLKNLVLSKNRIARIYPETFALLPHLEGIDLDENLLQSIPDDAFEKNLFLTNLSIEKNHLKSLRYAVVSRMHNTGVDFGIYVNKNPWVCDCDLYTMLEKSETLSLQHTKCATPSNMTWKDALDTLNSKC